MTRLITAFAVIAFLALRSLVPALAGSQDPRTVIIRSSDVPAAYHVEESQYVSNTDDAQAFHLSPSNLIRRGRIAGYSVSYGHVTSTGICCIENRVSQWRSSADASAAYRSLAQGLKAAYGGNGTVSGYLDHGQRYYDIFACQCDGRVEGVVQIIAHKGDFVSTVELRFLPTTIAPQTVAEIATHYTQMVLNRIS